jgi:hypothetical protein
MSNIYYLRNSQDPISFSVKVGTIGNPATSVALRRSGNSVKIIPVTPDPQTFNIPDTALGASADIAGATLVVTMVISFSSQDDLDQALANLFMSVTLSGGLDGTQSYTLLSTEKTLYASKKIIVAMKAIKLQTN